MRAEPYIFFQGRCAEAFEFYRKTLGAEITSVIRFSDLPGSPPDMDQVMHAVLRIGDTIVFGSDAGEEKAVAKASGFALSLQVTADGEAERLFAALARGGTVEVALMSTPFASRFAKVTDRFGTPWMIVNAS
jgi:PhnB protein